MNFIVHEAYNYVFHICTNGYIRVLSTQWNKPIGLYIILDFDSLQNSQRFPRNYMLERNTRVCRGKMCIST